MRTFEFTVVMKGTGRTADAAWNNATDAFSADPGPTPEDAKDVTDTEEDEEADES